MLNYATNIAAIALYIVASVYVCTNLVRLQPANKTWLLGLAVGAITAHLLGVIELVFQPSGYQLGFFIALSLITCVVNIIVALSGLRLPVLNLFLFLFPFSALSIGAALFSHSPLTPMHTISAGLLSHITVSFIAYALLSISAIQALFLAWQDHQLKHKHTTGRVRLLPPLQTMESLLFHVIWAGQITLTVSILSGFVFIQDMFAQSLVHKTALSIVAWLIYSVLLFGRHQQGWRGSYAIRWTLAGFCTLMMAYFGSKLVIELILGGQTL